MAKKTVAEMTAEELELRHAKAKERREKRRSSQLEAINEITALLTPQQLKSLSENAKHCIDVWKQEYKPASRITLVAGMSLMQLLAEHPNLSAKKLKSKCEELNLEIDWAAGVLKAIKA